MLKARSAALILATALAAAACAGSPAATGNQSPGIGSPVATAGSPVSGGTIKIGAILPLTGDGSAYGPGMETAIRIATDEINAAGGVNGQQLEILVEDDGTNPDQGVRAANKLIDVNKVQAIIGTWASSVTLAVAPLTIKANIVEINTSGNPKISDLADNNTVFRSNATDAALGATVAKQFFADGVTSITVLANNQAGSIGLAQEIRDAFTSAGGNVLDFIEYAEKQQSYNTEVNKALATKPDMYVLSCYTPDGEQVLKAAYEAGVTTKFAAPAYCLNGQLADAVGAQVVEGDISFDLVPVKESPAYVRLNDAYKAKTGQEVFDNAYAAHVYDGMIALALAMQKADSTAGDQAGAEMSDVTSAPGEKVESYADGLAALKAGKDIDYDGATGPIAFDAKGDKAPYVGIFEFKDGKPVLTKTFAGQ